MTRNYKFESHHSGKLILTSVVAATLGLIIMSPDMVKADTLTNSVAAKKQVNKNSSLSNSNRTTASVTSPDTDNNTTPEPSDNNVTQPETSLTSKTQASKDLSTVGNSTKYITGPITGPVMIVGWGGTDLIWLPDNGLLIIPGGTATNPPSIQSVFSDYQSIKKIEITKPLKLVGDAHGVFKWLTGLTEIKGLNQVDTSAVTNMEDMFNQCENLTSLDLSSFNTAGVTSMRNMFVNCKGLTSLDLQNFNTEKVTDMYDMFAECASLKTLNISSFQMSQVTNKTGVLSGLSNLSILILGPNNFLKNTYLNTDSHWRNKGNGSVDEPQGNNYWSSYELTENYLGTRDQDTYIRVGKVTVHYRDEHGKLLAQDQTLNGRFGTGYSSIPQNIAGYVLKTTPANAKGAFTDDPQEVTYVYAKNAPVNTGGAAGRQPIVGGSVTVHYQDETGKQLAPDRVLTGNVGEGYLTQEVALAGYKLTQRPKNATGFYTANPQSVTYIYSQNVTNRTAVRRTVFHNSYLYDQNGSRKTGEYFMGKTIWTYGTKVIQGKKYYDLGQDNYVKATNVSGVKRKLRRNSYIYNKAAKKLQRKALKKGQRIKTYGGAVKIHRKLYYIVGKNQYVKKSNF